MEFRSPYMMSLPSSLAALVARTDATANSSIRPPWQLQVEAHLRHNQHVNHAADTLLMQIVNGIQNQLAQWRQHATMGSDGSSTESQRPPVSLLEEIWISVEW